MIANSTWLTSGSALVDSHGHILESNDEFAFWAGNSGFDSVPLGDLLDRKCPGWKQEIEELFAEPGIFLSKYLEDTTVEPGHWYRVEVTRVEDHRALRIARCLPPIHEL